VKQLAVRSFMGPFILSAVLGGAVLGGAGCGGKKGTLSVDILVPQGADPFANATQAVITVGDPPIMQRIQPVSGGHFDASINFDLKSRSGLTGPVIVEARDGNGRVLGYGRTPPLAIVAVDEVVTVWVGRPGYAGLSPSVLNRGRVGMSVGAVPRLGVLLAGGAVNGAAVGDAEVYHEYTHTIIKAESIPTPRRDGAIIGFDRLGSTTGASALVGGAVPAPTDDFIFFDPVAAGTTAGRWTSLAHDDNLKRIAPALASIPGGSWLLCGGLDGGGVPLQTAVQLAVGSQLLINKTPQDMIAPRAGSQALGGQFLSTDGALIIGGNPAGTPTLERFVASSRTFVAVDGSDQLPPRTGHSVVQLPTNTTGFSNRIVVTGGNESGGPALASGWIINPTNLEISQKVDLLSKPRTRHVSFVAGNELLVCGGVDAQGQTLGDCEVLDVASLTSLRPPVPLAVRRKDFVAVPLETGEVLLAGGLDENDRPVPSIELYTAAR
jgi:hypothetical protein